MTGKEALALIAIWLVCASLAFVILRPYFADSTPPPRETPYLWIDPRPDGGACYVLGNTLGPCFEKPRTDEPSP